MVKSQPGGIARKVAQAATVSPSAGPDAAVDEAAGMQVAALDQDPPARVLVLDLQRLDAEIGGEAAHRELADVLWLDLREIGHVVGM